MLGLTGMGGGVASLMWGGIASVGPFDLWFCGSNEDGMGGINKSQSTTSRVSSPIQIPGSWKYIAPTGSKAKYGIKDDGTLWSWGNNEYGYLGLGDTNYRSSPTQIGTNTDWVNVSAGAYTVCAVRENGTLWTWGRNHSGQLGHNNYTNYSSPKQVPGTWPTSIYKVAAVDKGVIAITEAGALYMWGNNQSGQMMNNKCGQKAGEPDDYPTPQLIESSGWKEAIGGGSPRFATKDDDSLWTCGNVQGAGGAPTGTGKRSSPVQVPGTWKTNIGKSNEWRNFVDTNQTGDCTGGQTTDTTAYAWGYQTNGQLGNNSRTTYSTSKAISANMSGFDDVTCGSSNIFWVKDGALYGAGADFGAFAQPGNYSSPSMHENRSQPVQIGTDTDWYKVTTSSQAGWHALKEQA